MDYVDLTNYSTDEEDDRKLSPATKSSSSSFGDLNDSIETTFSEQTTHPYGDGECDQEEYHMVVIGKPVPKKAPSFMSKIICPKKKKIVGKKQSGVHP